jgi:hypothetical protein
MAPELKEMIAVACDPAEIERMYTVGLRSPPPPIVFTFRGKRVDTAPMLRPTQPPER